VRFRSQTTRRATFSARPQVLEEDIRMNDDALFETRRRLIHARLPTRIFNNIYSEPPASPPVRRRRMPAVRGAQGPPDEDDVPFHHPYKRPSPRQPAFCYECFELQPDHQAKDWPKRWALLLLRQRRPTSPSSASPRTCVARRTNARCLAGTTTTGRTVPPMPLGGLHAS